MRMLADCLRFACRASSCKEVRIADGLGVKWQMPETLWHTSLATTERDAVVQAIAAPSTRWVCATTPRSAPKAFVNG